MDTFIERLFCKLTKNYLLASLKLKQFDLIFKRKRVCKKFECRFKNRDIIIGSAVGLTHMFKGNNGNSRGMFKSCSKLTVKAHNHCK